MALAAHLVIAYLLGAFPSAVVIGRLVRGIDIRDHGSGNAGATNAWRVLGWRIGVPVMALDVAKGVVAATVVARLPLGATPMSTESLAILCGLAAVVGHVFPVYARFRGGKGVATAAGMLVAVAPLPAGCAVGVFALNLFLTGRVSLGSILAAWTVPIAILLLDRFAGTGHPPLLLGLALALALFILYTHRSNLLRLIRGQERSLPQLQLWRYLSRRR